MSRSHSETGLNMTVAQKGPPGQLGSPQVWGHKMKAVPSTRSQEVAGTATWTPARAACNASTLSAVTLPASTNTQATPRPLTFKVRAVPSGH